MTNTHVIVTKVIVFSYSSPNTVKGFEKRKEKDARFEIEMNEVKCVA